MIKLNTGGCDTKHPKDFVIGRDKGNQDYLILLTKSRGYFNIAGNVYETEPGAFFIIDKDIPYFYCNKDGEYINDWLHIEIDEPQLLEQLQIPMNQPLDMYDIAILSNFINEALSEHYGQNKNNLMVVDSYIRILLCKVSEQINEMKDLTKANYIYTRLRKLRKDIYNLPEKDWCVDDMASALNLSQSHFQHVYKNTFGVSAIRDVINSRIEKAKFYLNGSKLSIGQISKECGYISDMHFSRQFKKYMGMSPRGYRELILGTKKSN